jgi:hypothetical protein
LRFSDTSAIMNEGVRPVLFVCHGRTHTHTR